MPSPDRGDAALAAAVEAAQRPVELQLTPSEVDVVADALAHYAFCPHSDLDPARRAAAQAVLLPTVPGQPHA